MHRPSIDLDTIRRRVARGLGRRGKGKFVAIERRTGDYVVAANLDELAAALWKRRGKRDFQIVRLGYRAAIELRRGR
jgi:hypothetical protein